MVKISEKESINDVVQASNILSENVGAFSLKSSLGRIMQDILFTYFEKLIGENVITNCIKRENNPVSILIPKDSPLIRLVYVPPGYVMEQGGIFDKFLDQEENLQNDNDDIIDKSGFYPYSLERRAFLEYVDNGNEGIMQPYSPYQNHQFEKTLFPRSMLSAPSIPDFHLMNPNASGIFLNNFPSRITSATYPSGTSVTSYTFLPKEFKFSAHNNNVDDDNKYDYTLPAVFESQSLILVHVERLSG